MSSFCPLHSFKSCRTARASSSRRIVDWSLSMSPGVRANGLVEAGEVLDVGRGEQGGCAAVHRGAPSEDKPLLFFPCCCYVKGSSFDCRSQHALRLCSTP
jgi:hypothetical protein